MQTAKIGKGGQINIPKKVREHLDLEVGNHVAFVFDEGKVLLQPVKGTLKDLRGSIKVKGEQDFEAIRKKVLSKRARDRAKHD